MSIRFLAPLHTATCAFAALAFAACNQVPTNTAEPSSPDPVSATPEAAPAFTQVTGGGAHTCAITAEGRAYCWGFNTQPTPSPIQGSQRFGQISAGSDGACGVTIGHRIYCWNIGDKPVAIESPLAFQTVSAGQGHTCALTVNDRKAYCWGFNDYGQLGDGTQTFRTTPVPVAGGRAWREIAAGGLFTCGTTTDRQAFCWGIDEFGQLGNDAELKRRQRPSPVAGSHRFDQIDAGSSHACGIDTGGKAWCWGLGNSGQIGDGKQMSRPVPARVAGGLVFNRVTVGGGTTCGETTENRTYCWGFGLFGQLGTGVFNALELKPAAVTTEQHFIQVDAGDTHYCARTTAGVTYCWGYNFFGQLGDGTTTDRAVPTKVE